MATNHLVKLDCNHEAVLNLHSDLLTVGSVVRCQRCCKEVRVTEMRPGPDHSPVDGSWKIVASDHYSVLVVADCTCGDPECSWNGSVYQGEMFANSPGILVPYRDYLKAFRD
jgi:hypothetical protein